VWAGYFHIYVADSFGRPGRKKKEKALGPATMPKHEAQQKLAHYIEEFTGKLIHQGDCDRELRRSLERARASSVRLYRIHTPAYLRVHVMDVLTAFK